jgi:hypothetical protein
MSLGDEDKDYWMRIEESERAKQNIEEDKTHLETKGITIRELRDKNVRNKLIAEGYLYSISGCPFPCSEEKRKECKDKTLYGKWCDIAKIYLDFSVNPQIDNQRVYLTRIVSNKI